MHTGRHATLHEMIINCAGGVSARTQAGTCACAEAPEQARDAPRDDHKLRGDVHGAALDGAGAAERAAGDHLRARCRRAFIRARYCCLSITLLQTSYTNLTA
jgi:hypothetical protein